MEQDNLLEKEWHFVGAYLPPHLADFLRLYALSQGRSVQKMMMQLIMDRKDVTLESQLIEKAADQAYDHYLEKIKRQKLDGSQDQENTYIYQMRKDLERRKLSDEHIQQIITRLQDRLAIFRREG